MAALAADLVEFAVHVAQFPAAGAFVEIVDVLGDEQKFAGMIALEFGQRQVGGVGLDPGPAQIAAAVVVELQHLARVADVAVEGGDLFDVVALPKPTAAAKRLNARFGGNAGTGQDHDRGVAAHGRIDFGMSGRWYRTGAGPASRPGAAQ